MSRGDVGNSLVISLPQLLPKSGACNRISVLSNLFLAIKSRCHSNDFDFGSKILHWGRATSLHTGTKHKRTNTPTCTKLECKYFFMYAQ